MKTPSHLSSGAAAMLTKPAEDRIRYLQRDRFVNHSVAQQFAARLDDLSKRPRSIRPPCLALVGDAGSGKSTLIDRFMKSARKQDQHTGGRHAVSFVADPRPTIQVLQTALLVALAVPRPASIHRYRWEADELIRLVCADLGLRVVVIDEAQHLLNLPVKMQAEAWDWLKWISTACALSVVCSGIRGYERMLICDQQLQTRFCIVALPRWQAGPALAQFLMAYEQSLPLAHPSGLSRPEMQALLLQETRAKQQVAGITDGIRQVLEAAAIRAVVTGEERVTLSNLQAWRDLYG